MIVPVLLKKIRPTARAPEYATRGAAAMDLRACLDAPRTLLPGEMASLPTGIALALPSNEYVAMVFSRSGHGFKQGVTLVNSVGIIDADYRGEIAVGLINRGSLPFVVNDGDRIAQLAILPVFRAAFAWVEDLPESLRGEGGFGSTGNA